MVIGLRYGPGKRAGSVKKVSGEAVIFRASLPT